ncbi:hypothetical protein [Streptomyces cyaneochromogenes]|uniref:hypothetical protein n=1 Tax=Streptomyces cyaneochromogenes TaxID=2496836 RepID=UPI00158AAA8F|nr:hypothetical protein [Streptomyces cyaneochromogenes]
MLALQQSAGNAAVSRAMTVQRAPGGAQQQQPQQQQPQQQPQPQVPSQIAPLIARLERDLRAYDGFRLHHEKALKNGDYWNSRTPEDLLPWCTHIQQLFQHLDAWRAADPAVERWYTASPALDTLRGTIAGHLVRYTEQTQNYGYFLMYHFGRMWREPQMRGQPFNGSYLGHFASLSAETRHTLEVDLDVSTERVRHNLGGAQGPAWVDSKRAEIEAGLRQCVLRHYSPADRVESIMGTAQAPRPNPALKSAAILEKEPTPFQHNTGGFDFVDLTNHGFVFFYIEQAGAGFRGSRFGGPDPARITLPISMLEQHNGWVMQNDFLDREFPTIRATDQGEMLSYTRKPDVAQKQDKYLSVPAKSPEGQLKNAVHEAKALYAAAEERVQRVAKTSEQVGRLAQQGDKPDVLIRKMRQLMQQEKALRDEVAKIDQVKLGELQQKRASALDNSKKYSRQVRIHRPADMPAMTGHTQYTGPASQTVREEKTRSNVLVGGDIIPGLAQRCIVEIARIQRQQPSVGARLRAMSGDELINVLLKDFIRPQAMLQKTVPFTRADVEFKNPRP